MDKNEKEVMGFFEKFKGRFGKKAEAYANDKEKTADLLKKAKAKADKKKGPLTEIWDKVQLLFSLVGDYVGGKYKKIPFGSIVVIILSILYFISPVDFVPDLIPFGGLLDDATVLGFVIAQMNADLEKYKDWKETKDTTEQ